MYRGRRLYQCISICEMESSAYFFFGSFPSSKVASWKSNLGASESTRSAPLGIENMVIGHNSSADLDLNELLVDTYSTIQPELPAQLSNVASIERGVEIQRNGGNLWYGSMKGGAVEKRDGDAAPRREMKLRMHSRA